MYVQDAIGMEKKKNNKHTKFPYQITVQEHV